MEIFKLFGSIFVNNDEANKSIRRTGEEARTASDVFSKWGKTATEMAGKIVKFGAGAGAALSGLGIAAVKAGIDWESAFAGVKKTVDASDEQLQVISNGIRNMAKEMPMAAAEIAGIAESAGQLGIKTDSILGFTKVIADLGVATNLTGEAAASTLAKFANILQMDQGNFDRLGSTIVALGNNLATTEADIAAMAMRLAGAGSQIGLTEAQILSFAGALSSVGIEADAGGSAFSKVMVDMQLAVETGSARLNEFARVAGVSADEFSSAFRDNAASAMMTFVSGLNDVDRNGKSAISILDDMGISEVRLRDALLRAAGASDVFSDALELGSDAWEKNSALTDEAAQRYATFESLLEMLKNSVVDLGISFAESVNEPIRLAAQNGIKAINELSEEFKKPDMQNAIKSIGNSFAGLIDVISNIIISCIPPLVSGLGLLLGNLDKIAAILTPVITGFIAFKTVAFVQNVIEGISLAMAGYTAIATASEAATKGSTVGVLLYAAAQKASAVATGTANAVLGIYNAITGSSVLAIGSATVAQWNWNAAMSANPIGLIIAGVAALVAGIIVLVKWLNRESEEQKALKTSTKALKEENDGLLTSIKESGKAYEDNTKDIIANAGASKKLADRVFELAAQENKSAAEKQKLALLVDQLNQSVPELNLLLDEEGNITGRTAEQVYGLIEAKMEEAKQQAVRERAVELAKEQMVIEEQLNIIKQQQAEWDINLENGVINKKAYEQASKDLAEQEAQLSAKLIETNNSIDFVAEAMVEAASATANLAEANKKTLTEFEKATQKQNELSTARERADTEATEQMIINASRMGITLDEYKDKLKETEKEEAEITKKREETLRKYTDLALDMFDKIETESKISITQMADNLEHNQNVINKWGDNILALEGKIDQGLLETLKKAGPESAATVNMLVNANDKELQRLSEVFNTGGEVAANALLKALGGPDVINSGSDMVDNIANGVEKNENLNNATKNLIAGAKNTSVAQVKASNFFVVGSQIIEGIVNGITAGQEKVFTAMRNMATTTLTVANSVFKIQSPSKEFEQMFKYNMEGAVQGIDKGKGKVKKTMAQAMKEVYDIAKSHIEDYRNASDYSALEEIKMWEVLKENYSKVSTQKVEIDKNIAKLRTAADKEAFDKSKNWIEARKFFGLLSAKEEIAAWERVALRYKEGSKEREEADRSLYTLRNKLEEDSFNNSKSWFETRKFFGISSLQDEINFWVKMTKEYEENTKLREEADKALFDARKRLSEEQEKITANMEAAEEKYAQAVQNRAQAIFDGFGFFEQFSANEDKAATALRKASDEYDKAREALQKLTDERFDAGKTEEQLIKIEEEYIEKQSELTEASKRLAEARTQANKTGAQILSESLSSQIEGMTKWGENLEELARRGLDEGIIEELKKMGTSAYTEVENLTKSTDTQLTEVSKLWQEKQALARKLAVGELKGLRKDTDVEIKNLADDLNKIAETNFVFAGANTTQGFIDGIKSKFNDLRETMREMADIVGETVSEGLEIASPSKLFKRIGIFTGLGFVEGIRGMSNAINDAVDSVFGDLSRGVSIGANFDAVGGVAMPYTPMRHAFNDEYTRNNSGDLVIPITIENFNSNNIADVTRLSQELAFYVNQQRRGRGN